jgi:hypothetical protein
MFGLIKRFFSKSAPVELSSAPPAPVQPAHATPAATPVPAPPPPAAAAFHAAPKAAAGPDGVIAVPLPPIIESLPAYLAALAASPGAGTFSVPVKTVLAQLASGAVKITFGELRQGSPPGTFYDNATQDRSLVSLPLQTVLASLDPALLTRRQGQKTVIVPESVTSVFGVGRRLQDPLTTTPAPAPAPVSTPAGSFSFHPATPAGASDIPDSKSAHARNASLFSAPGQIANSSSTGPAHRSKGGAAHRPVPSL